MDIQPFLDTVTNWILDSGPTVLTVIIITALVERFGAIVVTRIVKRSFHHENYTSEREEKLRENTVISMVTTIVRVSIILIAIMVLLSELGLEIGPLLAGAGVAGFAIGFGAQNLIKDFIAGIFVVLENQYRVGDVVELNGVSGTVQKISMRITVLRDLDGNVHYIPNGSVSYATNMTMEYARINMEIGVDYASDMDKVREVVNQVGVDMAKDKDWKDYILEAPYYARLHHFGDSAIIVKIFGKVQPAKQWSVEGELRRRLKIAFDKNKISIPFPQRVIHQAKKK